jgi:AraC-like DNA-binding protein
LSEARRLMLADNQDAMTAAFQVGYESPSQFSRPAVVGYHEFATDGHCRNVSETYFRQYSSTEFHETA